MATLVDACGRMTMQSESFVRRVTRAKACYDHVTQFDCQELLLSFAGLVPTC